MAMLPRMLLLAVVLCSATVHSSTMPSVVLRNAADANVLMPAIGLGTGPPGNRPNTSLECWQYPGSATAALYGFDYADCGNVSVAATLAWMQVGGRYLDMADSYLDENGIAEGIRMSGVARKDLFITSKVGPFLFPLGYNDTIEQFKTIQQDTNWSYVDLLLIHAPEQGKCKPNLCSRDPRCVQGSGSYNGTVCRLETWRAMLHIWRTGGARAVGVSNYNQQHLEEIKSAQLELPAVVQNQFNPGNAKDAMPFVEYCRAHNITFNAYSPLGAPKPGQPSLLRHPAIERIAVAHNRTTAQVILNWEWSLGMPTPPLSSNPAHLRGNLQSLDFSLSPAEAAVLADLPPLWRSYDCLRSLLTRVAVFHQLHIAGAHRCTR